METEADMTFSPLWSHIVKRCDEHAFPLVQERSELLHIYGLMKGCDCGSYLEVGSAEGNSLYVLGHAVGKGGRIITLNIEDHTHRLRKEIVEDLKKDHPIFEKIGDSTYSKTIADVCGNYDCVLIDAAHDPLSVLSDAIHYGMLAKKYIFFHDVKLPEVKVAVDFYVERWKPGRYSEVIHSPTFGFGIVEITR